MFGKKKKKKALPPDDDGRTIANMNVEGLPWYNPYAGKKVAEEDKPNRKEKRSLILGAFRAYLPQFLIILAGFSIALILLIFWLNGWFV